MRRQERWGRVVWTMSRVELMIPMIWLLCVFSSERTLSVYIYIYIFICK